ncbi:hypothetical protein SCUP515_06680 [Seiridium cupressi]
MSGRSRNLPPCSEEVTAFWEVRSMDPVPQFDYYGQNLLGAVHLRALEDQKSEWDDAINQDIASTAWDSDESWGFDDEAASNDYTSSEDDSEAVDSSDDSNYDAPDDSSDGVDDSTDCCNNDTSDDDSEIVSPTYVSDYNVSEDGVDAVDGPAGFSDDNASNDALDSVDGSAGSGNTSDDTSDNTSDILDSSSACDDSDETESQAPVPISTDADLHFAMARLQRRWKHPNVFCGSQKTVPMNEWALYPYFDAADFLMGQAWRYYYQGTKRQEWGFRRHRRAKGAKRAKAGKSPLSKEI